MKKSIRFSASIVLAVILSASFTIGPVHADMQEYRKISDRNMSGVRGLQSAKITWQETQVNYNLHWLRNLQTFVKSLFSQEAEGRAVGGASSSASGTSSTQSGSQTASSAAVNPEIYDAGLKSFVTGKLANDNLLTRQDMIDVFRYVELDNWVTQAEFDGLRTISAYRSLFPQPDHVWSLANNVINGDLWNATYNGVALGNLTANVPGTYLESLVGKWFYGNDRPDTLNDYGVRYGWRIAQGKLFVSGASYTDVRQGMLGDCWFLAALEEIAVRTVSIINTMFIDNGDNTFTVRLYNNRVADYFTVDRYLPVDSYGRFVFANIYSYASSQSNELWVALAEKAAVHAYSSWWGFKHEYMSISGDYIGYGMTMVSGYTPTYLLGYNNGAGMTLTDFNTALSAWNSGALIGFASKSTPSSSSIVGNHAYAVVGYNKTTKLFTLANPFGANNAWGVPALISMSWSVMRTNFAYFDIAKKI